MQEDGVMCGLFLRKEQPIETWRMTRSHCTRCRKHEDRAGTAKLYGAMGKMENVTVQHYPAISVSTGEVVFSTGAGGCSGRCEGCSNR